MWLWCYCPPLRITKQQTHKTVPCPLYPWRRFCFLIRRGMSEWCYTRMGLQIWVGCLSFLTFLGFCWLDDPNNCTVLAPSCRIHPCISPKNLYSGRLKTILKHSFFINVFTFRILSLLGDLFSFWSWISQTSLESSVLDSVPTWVIIPIIKTRNNTETPYHVPHIISYCT